MIMVLYFNHSLSDRFGLSRLKSLRNMMEMFEMKYNMYITWSRFVCPTSTASARGAGKP